MDFIRPTPRNYLAGLLADKLQGGLDFATNNGKNKPMNFLAELLGVTDMQKGAERFANGGSLTTGGGLNTRLHPDIGNAFMAALPFAPALTKPVTKGAGLLAEGLRTMEGSKAMPSAGGNQFGAIVWHGSPHKFDAFDASKIGTGEGAPKHSAEQMAIWAEQKKANDYRRMIASNSQREAEKTFANNALSRYKEQGVGQSFDENQLQSIMNYAISGDRKGANAEGAFQSVNSIKKELDRLGVPIDKVSQKNGGNSIYAKVNNETVRISDHSLPLTPQRTHNRDIGLNGKWDREIVLDDWKNTNLKDYIADILRNGQKP